MLSLKKAVKHAKAMTNLHGEQWLVFQVPSSAKINQHPYNVHNDGVFACCRESERAEYEAGGAAFPTMGPDKLNPAIFL